MILHALTVIAGTSFSALSFWGLVVIDARRQQARLAHDVRIGKVKIFSAGGVVYHEAEPIDGSLFIAARPVHVADGQASGFVILDPRSIARAVSTQALGIDGITKESGAPA